jgi:hypothetical protein
MEAQLEEKNQELQRVRMELKGLSRDAEPGIRGEAQESRGPLFHCRLSFNSHPTQTLVLHFSPCPALVLWSHR